MTEEEKIDDYYYKRAMLLMMNGTSGAENKTPKAKRTTTNRFDKAKITQLLHKKK